MPNPIEIRRNPDGSIDEIIADGKIHIEQMSGNGFYMGVEMADGSHWRFWFGSLNYKSRVGFRLTEMSPGPGAIDSVITPRPNPENLS